MATAVPLLGQINELTSVSHDRLVFQIVLLIDLGTFVIPSTVCHRAKK